MNNIATYLEIVLKVTAECQTLEPSEKNTFLTSNVNTFQEPMKTSDTKICMQDNVWNQFLNSLFNFQINYEFINVILS